MKAVMNKPGAVNQDIAADINLNNHNVFKQTEINYSAMNLYEEAMGFSKKTNIDAQRSVSLMINGSRNYPPSQRFNKNLTSSKMKPR